MADNVELNSGSGGATLATDDLGGVPAVQVQRVKVGWGPDGTLNDVDNASNKRLPVNIAESATLTVNAHAVTNAGTFAVQESGSQVQVDDAAFTPATSQVSMIGAEFDDTTPDSVDEGDGGAVRMSGNRNLYTTIRDSAGNERGLKIDANGFIGVTDGGGALTVDGTVAATQSGTWDVGTVTAVTAITNALPAGTNAIGKLAANSGVDIGDVDVTSIVPGSGATNLGKAEDAAHSSGDVGVMALGVRKDTAAATAGTDGDYQPITSNARGASWVAIEDGAGGQITSFGGGTQYTEDAAAAANPIGNALILVREDARGGSLTTTDGDNVAARGTNAGELYVKHVDAIPITDNSGSLTVDYATTGSGNATGALRVELANNGTGVLATVGAVTTITNVVHVDDNSGSLTVDNAGTFAVQAGPATSGGCSMYHKVSAATDNAANIKASAGQVFGITIFNNAAYPVYVKLHNSAGTPTAGAGVVRAFGCQAGTSITYPQPMGMAFGTGIAITIIKDIADAGTTAVAASDCVVGVEYK